MQKFPRLSLAPAAGPVVSATSSISPGKVGRTSRCVEGTPCKSMNANAPSTLPRLDRRLQSHGIVRHNDFVLKFWHDPYEMTLFPDGRAIIKGTTDTAVARSFYARYVGS